MTLRAKDIRLSECFVVGALDFETEYFKPTKQRIRVDTEIPEDLDDTELVEVRCVYERESLGGDDDDEATGWRIAMLVQMSGADSDTSKDDVIRVAMETSHPYVRQLLTMFSSLARNPSLSLPVSPPRDFTPVELP